MKSARVYLDGEFLDREEARIAADDAGLLYGEGVFETLRVTEGRALDVSRHLARLQSGAEALHIELTDGVETLAAAIRELAREAPRPHARLRVTVTAGIDGVATRLVTVQRYELPGEALRRGGVAVISARSARVDSTSPLCGIKSTSFLLYRLAANEAAAAGAYEALLVNERGELAEGSRTNVFAVIDGLTVTPPLSSGALPGIARQRLLEAGLAVEAVVGKEQMARTEAMMLSNSLIGALPVASLDGRSLRLVPEVAAWQATLEAVWQRG